MNKQACTCQQGNLRPFGEKGQLITGVVIHVMMLVISVVCLYFALVDASNWKLLIIPGLWLVVNLADFLIHFLRLVLKKHTKRCSARYAAIRLLYSGPPF